MKRGISRSSAFLLVLLLQACGGGGSGGGGGGNPPPAPAPTLALLNSSTAENAGIITFGLSENAFQAMALVTEAAQLMQDLSLDPLSVNCALGGTVVASAIDRNGNGSLNASDRVLITYAACNGSVSGTLTLDISAVTLAGSQITLLDGTVTINLDFIDPPPAELTGSLQLAYRASATELNWLGTGVSVRLTIGGRSEALSGGRIQNIVSAPALTYDVTLSGTIDSDQLEGRITFTTSTAFAGVEGRWPESGRVTLRGHNNSTVAFRTVPNSQTLVGYEVDADGNGVIDEARSMDWEDLSLGVLFGVPAGGVIPQPDPGPDAFGRRIVLDGVGEDVIPDPVRGRLYVTVPDRHELLVVSAQTLEIVRRLHLASRPAGLSLSADGQELFVGLAAAGSIAVIDADLFTVSTIFVAPELESSWVFNVVETEPGVLYAGTGVPDAAGRIVRIDRATGIVTMVAASTDLFGEIELAVDPARRILYAGDGQGGLNARLHKYDAADPSTPLLLAAPNTGFRVTDRLSLDPTGSRIYLTSGLVMNTSDLSRFGDIAGGAPWASENGMDVMVGTGEENLAIYSASNLSLIDVIRTDCDLDAEFGGQVNVDRIAPSPVDGQWLLLGGHVLCAIDLSNPDVRPGTGQPGVQPEPLPATTVQTARVIPGGTIADVEFDNFRNRLYVTIPSSGELITIDGATHQVIDRDVLGNTPHGLDLSPDGATLAIMFNGNGHIGFKDLASGQTEMRDLTPFLGTTFGHDVVYLSDDAIFASTDQQCCDPDTFLVRTSRSDPAATRRTAGGIPFGGRIEMTPSPAGDFLYVSGPVGLSKLDLNAPDEPVIRTSNAPEVGDFFAPRISPDGSRLVFRDGTLLRTSDLFQVGKVGPSLPSHVGTDFSSDGTSIYQAFASLAINRHDPATLQATWRFEPSDSCTAPNRLFSGASGNRIITVSQITVCFWMLDQPVAAGQFRSVMHSPYACDAGCLVRQYQRRTGSSLPAWRLAGRSRQN